MKRYLLFGLIVGLLFGTGNGSFADPPVVWSQQLGLQQLWVNRIRIEDVRKNQNDSRKVAKFYGVFALPGTNAGLVDCNLKARWNRRKMRVQIFRGQSEFNPAAKSKNITAKVKRGAYVFRLAELDVEDGRNKLHTIQEFEDSGAYKRFFIRVKKGRKAFRQSPIHLISSRVSGGGNGKHQVTIIGN